MNPKNELEGEIILQALLNNDINNCSFFSVLNAISRSRVAQNMPEKELVLFEAKPSLCGRRQNTTGLPVDDSGWLSAISSQLIKLTK